MNKTSSMYLYVKLNWDANRFLPAESKDCMNSASYEFICVFECNFSYQEIPFRFSMKSVV